MSQDQVLSIVARHGIADIEDALARLVDDCDLLLPTNLHHPQFGGLGALLQLIITWARRSPRGRLRTYVTDSKQDIPFLESLIQEDHGLAAFLLAHDITDRVGTRSLRSQSLRFVQHRLASMDILRTAMRGDKAFLIAADHTSFNAPDTLYAKTTGLVDPPPRSWSGFLDLTSQLLQRLKQGLGSTTPEPVTIRRMATVLRELLQNTHDWARHDVDGSRLSPSIRGLRTELYSHDPHIHKMMVAQEPFLSHYIASVPTPQGQSRQRLVELTVFDSGPGLAARRLRQIGIVLPPSIDAEHGALVDCLRTHFTTGSTSHRGDGLHQVMVMLTELRGFIRIRSGRIALARDFIALPYIAPGPRLEPFLLDWKTQELSPTVHASTAGTLITLLFPVRYAD